jgi:Tfp pilus assembly protein PilO
MSERLFPLIAFFVALGIFFFYVNPQWTKSIAIQKATIEADNQALLAAQQYNTQKNQLASARDAIDPANLSALKRFLPDSADNVGLILDLNALAARSGLAVSNIDMITSAGAPSKNSSSLEVDSPINTADMSLSVTGTFSAFQTFLLNIEKSARLLDVHDIVVKGSDTGVYTYQMTVRIYWLH